MNFVDVDVIGTSTNRSPRKDRPTEASSRFCLPPPPDTRKVVLDEKTSERRKIQYEIPD